MGGTSACPLVGRMVAGPLVGQAVSRGVSQGGCGLRKCLGSLFLMSGTVPILLVVWLKKTVYLSVPLLHNCSHFPGLLGRLNKQAYAK